MVSVIWFILSLFGVCDFNWWPVFIEGIVYTLVAALAVELQSENEFSFFRYIPFYFSFGVTVFAALKLFFGLTISPWWILLAGVWILLALVFPGGFTLTYLWFEHMNVITHSKVLLIILIIIDILMLLYFIVDFCSSKKEKRKKEQTDNSIK